MWGRALERYWDFVQPRNLDLEHALDMLDLGRIRRMDARGWYEFLRDEYFRWKYTAPNRYVTTARQLRRYEDEGALELLDRIKVRLLALDRGDAGLALSTACEIRGLGTAGASGLLALMYPEAFGTVDQFAVKALRDVDDLAEEPLLAAMNPDGLNTKDGVLLIGIMRRRAAQNNRLFNTDEWTPRKIDKVLWTYGRH
jgi:hypothetical protein